MIARVGSGKSTAGLIRYLFDTKEAKDHTDPHLVASWDGFAPDPGRADDFDATKKLLVADLDLRVKQARRLGRGPKQHVWHCSIRAAPEDRILSDDEWAEIARRIVAATGIAPEGDPDGCRWVAVRHAPDHIHIAATKVRGDLSPARHRNDYFTAGRELAAVEKEYGLRRVPSGDRTAAKRPTRAELEKARRAGHDQTARERLRIVVRTAVAAAVSTEEFFRILAETDAVLVNVKHFPSGDVRGYTVALRSDTNGAKEPIWYSGSGLSPDLSFPKIRQRLEAVEPRRDNRPGRSRTNPWYLATAAAERIPHHLDQTDAEAGQAHLAAFGEALDALPLRAPQALRPHLRQAASAFERATRSRVRAEHHHARALRGAVRAMVREPAPRDGALLAMFLDAALLVVMAAIRWHDVRRHEQQVVAARQTLLHLRAAYDQAAATPLAAVARRRPDQPTVERQIRHIQQVAPRHADEVLEDPGFDALTAVLAEAEKTGHDPVRLLRQAAEQRAMDDARNPAQVLTWRIKRLSASPVSSTPGRTPLRPSPSAQVTRTVQPQPSPTRRR
ncbi:relaxase/mobilization nuclease domain-containing protein [Streptomyces tsukubensis]